MHAECLLAIKLQGAVRLKEMVVATDLHRTVTRIDDLDCKATATCTDFDVAIQSDDFAGYDAGLISCRCLPRSIGLWTVTSLVPSGNVPST